MLFFQGVAGGANIQCKSLIQIGCASTGCHASVRKGVMAQGCKTLLVQIPAFKILGQPSADLGMDNNSVTHLFV